MEKIKKMDELEIKITQNSIKVSYLVTTLLLAVWSLYDIINDRNFSLANMLFCVNILVLLASRLIFSKKYDLLKNITYIFIGFGAIAVIAVVIVVGIFLNK